MPSFCDRCPTRIGRVAPINRVGTSTSASVTAAVDHNGIPSASSPTTSKIASENRPKTPVASSMTARSGSSLREPRLDSQPPARLPRPSPTMNAVTTMVTDSMFTPKMRNKARCQTSW